MPSLNQQSVSMESISLHVPDSLIDEVEQTLAGVEGLTCNGIFKEFLYLALQEGLTAGGLDLTTLRGHLEELCRRLNVEQPDRSRKISAVIQSVIPEDSRLSELFVATVESDTSKRVVVINRSASPSSGISITHHQPSTKVAREYELYFQKGIPPNSWEYIPELLAKRQQASFDQPVEPDFKLNLLAEDLGQLKDVRNLQLLIETVESPLIRLAETHIFALVRASAAVDRPDLVERAYKMLTSQEQNTPFLLSAVIKARAESGRWAEALQEFETYARGEDPLRFINERVCGHALNCASSAGLRDKTGDILGFMRRYSIPISAIDLTVVLQNQTRSSSMIQTCQDFLPITLNPDVRVFMPLFKQLRQEFKRHHQHKVRTGTVSSGFGQLRENMRMCLTMMNKYGCRQNHFSYPKVIRLLSDLDEILQADELFRECCANGQLSNSGIQEILEGVYHPAARNLLLDVGNYGMAKRDLQLPVHGILEEIQMRSAQGSLKKKARQLTRDVLLLALRSFDDQVDLLDSLSILYPKWASTIRVRKLRLICERDKPAARNVVDELLATRPAGETLNSDDWLIATNSVAKLGDISLGIQWIGFLIQQGQLEFVHLRELINCALTQTRHSLMDLNEKTEFLYDCEQHIRTLVASGSIRRGDDSDWTDLMLHLLKAYADIGSRQSIIRLEREMRSQGLSHGVAGLAVFSDAVLDDPSNNASVLAKSSTWSEMLVLLEDVVHELNQPLLGAANSLKVVRKRILGGQSADQLLEPIGRLEGHLERITQRITEYANSFEYHDSALMASDFKQVLLDVLARSNATILSLGAEIQLDGPKSAHLAPISPVMLRIVLTNALRNSLEAFEEAKTPNPTISLAYGIHASTKSQRKKFYFTVVDNGPGIPLDKLKLVWDRGVSTKRGRGLGLGLPLIRSIIERAGGNVQMESPSPGSTAGTRLTVRL